MPSAQCIPECNIQSQSAEQVTVERQLAEFETIMQPAMALCFESQGGRVEIAAQMVLTIKQLTVDYKDKETEVNDVIDIEDNEWGLQVHRLMTFHAKR